VLLCFVREWMVYGVLELSNMIGHKRGLVDFSNILYFILSGGAITQLNHWTKRVVSTRLITLDPRD